MDMPTAHINLPQTGPSHLAHDLLTRRVLAGELSEVRIVNAYSLVGWDDALTVIQRAAKQASAFTVHAGRQSTAYVTTEELDIIVSCEWAEDWTIILAAKNSAKASKWEAAMHDLLPAPPPPPPPPPLPDNIIPVSFWMQDQFTGGAAARRRKITVQPWAEIEGNYSSDVRAQLGELMATDDPGSGGKLALMHGPPGTGKTRSILSLFYEWKAWCHASVVTDAERFFGDPNYLNDLVFGSEGMAEWLLIVIEDGDEFVNVQSKDSKGQSIARLLNMADGIVGQGLNLLTLITTNVPMDQLNPALARSGRCMADIHVGAFSEADSRDWLTRHDLDPELVSELSEDPVLADLYELKRISEKSSGSSKS
jgi:hypothetical protein